MSDTVIRVENLGKKYVIGHQQPERYTALRDVIASRAQALLNPFRKQKSKIQNSQEEFWALKDVSFEIKQGDRVGIIGRNGAGKSTLLKILSRITEPTKGSIRIQGRVASLLEVGTGFHPELTGRENIYLNGAILGMRRVEIKKKFDEMVAFAEVEKFLDTPVKRYSSGMYVRLAFAVAAHLEPEILVVDEVLAVGDAQFQKKCLGKMEEVGKEGRTVLFVSHNMSTVRQLCTRACLLAHGSVVYYGSPSGAISQYMQESVSKDSNRVGAYRHIKGDGRAEIQKMTLNDSLDSECLVSIFEPIKIAFDYIINENISYLEFFLLIYSLDGEVQASLFQRDSGKFTIPCLKKGRVILTFQNTLMPGKYMLSAGILDNSRQFVDWIENAEFFYVESSFNDGRVYDHRLGKLTLLGDWQSESLNICV
ncbi:MAG: ABC transporter ATP-binding protein [Stigonema ocellatum SAG 48.90 = DSM 106950]|nr:ABC transporter ATP-binding protein [Stigonema ocellatum SAG 48.90 = DSM 106950]